MIKFNISPSALNVYNKSELEFYYTYIKKSKIDTITNHVYGMAGNIVHDCLERIINGSDVFTINAYFEKQWLEQELNEKIGFGRKPLDKEQYKTAFEIGARIIENKYDFVKAEDKIVIPLLNNDKYDINIKGIIDAVAITKDGRNIIVDWKTSSSIDNSGAFKLQGLFYAFLVWKQYGYFTNTVIFEYTKIQRTKVYEFTDKQIMDFENYLKRVLMDIVKKGKSIENYSLGNYNHIFNSHLKKCMTIAEQRDSSDNIINIKIQNNYLYFTNLPLKVKEILKQKYKYFKDGAEFSEKFKTHLWDGYICKFSRNRLPIGLKIDFEELINDYNIHFNTNFKIKYDDQRDKDIINKTFNTEYARTNIVLRTYQKDAIDRALKNKIGILAMGTGSGKTITSAELIKSINGRSLILMGRIELVKQTKEVYEKYLKIKIGEISEGDIDISKQISVASIQTIDAVLKRNDKSSEELIKYLYNLNTLIFDEAQNCTDVNTYGNILKYATNLKYILGLSGSPWRSSSDTLEMNCLIGFPIYTKTTEELIKLNYLVPVKSYFISLDNESEDDVYSVVYNDAVIENEERNDTIINICEKFRAQGKKILILTKHIKHGELLNSAIDDSRLITSKTPRKDRYKFFQEFKNNDIDVLIGSTQIFSQGIDIPDLDVIINSSAHKSSIITIQTIGRVMRKNNENKKCGYYIDIYDKNNKYLTKAAKERINILEKYKHKIKHIEDINEIE